MRQRANKGWERESRLTGAYLLGGRVLLLVTAILLAVMPLTEHYWTFDHFLRGGQDLELTLLATLAVFCLLLLLTKACTEKMAILMALREWLSLPCKLAGVALRGLHVRSAAGCISSVSSDNWPASFQVSLQI